MSGPVTGHDGEVSPAQSSLMVHPGPSLYLVRAGGDLTASQAPPSRSTAGCSRVSAANRQARTKVTRGVATTAADLRAQPNRPRLGAH
jgi:hypothetical protein